jgi:Mn2+/Fe2+ NRAMP family transporter
MSARHAVFKPCDDFIILTTALTLHRHGITNIETSRQAAEALIPFAGKFAAVLFTTGVLGVGFLAIPTLAGSAAYAYAETFGWHQGLDAKFKSARAFYGIVICSTLVGIALDYARVSPVKALFYTAVINGLLAPFLLLGVLAVATDQKSCTSKLALSIVPKVSITTLLMFAAAIECSYSERRRDTGKVIKTIKPRLVRDRLEPRKESAQLWTSNPRTP